MSLSAPPILSIVVPHKPGLEQVRVLEARDVVAEEPVRQPLPFADFGNGPREVERVVKPAVAPLGRMDPVGPTAVAIVEEVQRPGLFGAPSGHFVGRVVGQRPLPCLSEANDQHGLLAFYEAPQRVGVG